MFIACNPYKNEDSRCTDRVLIFNTNNLDLSYMNLEDFSKHIVKFNEDGSQYYSKDIASRTKADWELVKGLDKSLTNYLHDAVLQVIDYGRDFRVGRVSRLCSSSIKQAYTWLFMESNNCTVVKVKNGIGRYRHGMEINGVEAKFSAQVCGLHYMFKFRDYCILRFRVYGLGFVSVALDKNSNIKAIWSVDFDYIYGDKGLGTYVDLVSGF